MVVLVTGGAGYIGSHVCKELLREGFVPVTYDNLSTGHAYAVKYGPFVCADLNDSSSLHQAFAEFQPKAVLHFAANAIVSESMAHPGMYYRNNVGSTLALLEAMRQFSVDKLVFSSTCATYGHAEGVIEETHPQKPINPYGTSKWMVEQILADFQMAHGIQSAILRYFNAAGADGELEIGEHHAPETHLIPRILLAALGVEPEVIVYGADFPTPDGSAIRDYIHVQDLARAHVLALQWLLAGEASLAVNLGSGTGYSVFEVIRTVEAQFGTSIPMRVAPKRPGEPSRLTASSHKAEALLGWTPRCSSLDAILTSAWKWHQLLLKPC